MGLCVVRNERLNANLAAITRVMFSAFQIKA